MAQKKKISKRQSKSIKKTNEKKSNKTNQKKNSKKENTEEIVIKMVPDNLLSPKENTAYQEFEVM